MTIFFFSASLGKGAATKSQRHEVEKCYAFSLVPSSLCGYIQFYKKLVTKLLKYLSLAACRNRYAGVNPPSAKLKLPQKHRNTEKYIFVSSSVIPCLSGKTISEGNPFVLIPVLSLSKYQWQKTIAAGENKSVANPFPQEIPRAFVAIIPREDPKTLTFSVWLLC